MTVAAIGNNSTPATLNSLTLREIAHSLSLYQFNVEQYQRLIAADVLPEGGTFELLDGLILRKENGGFGDDPVGHNPPHALVVSLLSLLIARVNSPKRHLRIQLPIVLDADSAPEPDASIVRGSVRSYAKRLPIADDVLCVIEAADASLERDASRKSAAYARAGIPQYLIVSLRSGMIEEHTAPNSDQGSYARHKAFARGETFTLQLGDEESIEVAVDELLS